MTSGAIADAQKRQGGGAMASGVIADIQRASVHDGPGLRTAVFFKGCPLRCAWCHNPECISFEPQLLYYPEKCIHCGRCAEGCFSGARVVCGREMTVSDVMEEILADRDYYGGQGGVTFTGGEPLAQREFLRALIQACRQNGVRTAVETSLVYYDESLFGMLDLVMADLKIWDSGIHKTYTGAGNEEIKAHFEMLDRLGVPIIARTPVIPGIEQGIGRISAFLKGLQNVVQYELLPYHPLGVPKQRALGQEERRFEIPSGEYMKELNNYAYIR